MNQRIKLREARGDRSRQEAADDIGCSPDSLKDWENGNTYPSPHYLDKLCKYYCKNPVDLDLNPELDIIGLEDIIRMLQRYDSRAVLEALQPLVGIDLLALADAPTPEEFLEQCDASIKACWHLLKHDGLRYASQILHACIPKLSAMATHNAPYQQIAASLAAEAKIQQVILATHKLDYRERGIHSLAAIRFAKLSGDGSLLAEAISWQADFHTSSWNRLPSPKQAIALCLEGLASLEDSPSLSRAQLSINLAKAYALDRQESRARELIEQARMFMPAHPEQDPVYPISSIGLTEIIQQEGRIYLELHKLFPDQGYGQMAYDVFNQGSEQIRSERAYSQFLIYKADAALVIGDLGEFIRCLEGGTLLAFQINSTKRQREVRKVLNKTPVEWQQEQAYLNLVKMF